MLFADRVRRNQLVSENLGSIEKAISGKETESLYE